jgi:hypothetical protein
VPLVRPAAPGLTITRWPQRSGRMGQPAAARVRPTGMDAWLRRGERPSRQAEDSPGELRALRARILMR